MITSQEGLIEIISHEGVCLRPYLDSVGVWTIGIGITKYDGGIKPDDMPKDQYITMKEAFDRFKVSIRKYEKRVNDAVKVELTQNQFDALVSFDYNTGGIVKATATKLINSKASPESVAKALLMWNKPPEIMGRRKKEADLYLWGKYGDGKALLFDTNGAGKVNYKKGKMITVADYL